MSEKVNLQPTEEMIQAGINSLWDSLPGAMDELVQQVDDDDERRDMLSDTIVFIWQAMHQASHK